MYFEEFLNVDASQVLLPGLPNVLVGRGVKLISSEIVGNLDIGDFTCINRSHLEQGCGIGVSSYIGDTSIGHFAMIGSRVSIGGFEHPTSWLSMAAFQWGQSVNHWNVSVKAKQALQKVKKPSYKRTRIGPDSWIGNNAVVLSEVSVGIGSVVGAASVVTKDVPPYGIVVGNPAKLIRFRFDTRTISTLPFDNIEKCLELIESSR